MANNTMWFLIGATTGYAISDTINFLIKQYKLRKAKALLKMMVDIEKSMKDIEKELGKRKEDNDNDVFK